MIERLPDSRFSVIGRAWEAQTVAVFGGGPSITQAQVDRCKNIPCIAVNDAYLLAPWATMLYFADSQWWRWHHERSEFKSFAGHKVTIEPSCYAISDNAVHWLRNYSQVNGRHLSDKQYGVSTGNVGSSGYQAINIAYLAGARRILLLGFDAKMIGGKTHWFGDHPEATPNDWLRDLPRTFQYLADALEKKGVKAVNCSLDSALDCFPKMTLEAALAACVLPN